ncbi:septum formation family protein [Jonesiaceae bacterium BS-20]|uniref:Septum formation family protein n=1 Tax=Jonesiaceae bacterium BS-20 TaxID=3120821 RepID=A0AAU7DY30_9MICO
MIPAGVPPMMVDASKTVSTPIADLTLEHCLGNPDVQNAMAQTTDCSEPGAFEILGIATLGEGAPAAKPDGATQDQLAFKVCDVFYEDWAKEHGASAAALFKTIVISDDWNGPSTALVCGGRSQS